ncbi:MAG: phosphodiester glycosidase family protein [Deltaproteobacteria bacterium]|nr:phosphodiester glycosidase family protein [Deltaproteobacteria bacterium]
MNMAMRNEIFARLLRRPIPLLVLAAFALLACASQASKDGFREIAPGIWLAEFDSPVKATTGTSKIIAVRADPEKTNLALFMSSHTGGRLATVKEWAEAGELLACINASMYQADHKTSTGLMRRPGHVNNPRKNKRFGAYLLFDPSSADLPAFRMMDREDRSLKGSLKKYRSAVQNYRMINSERKITWAAGGSATPIACVSVDGKGRALFIFSESLYTVHDFARAILLLPMDVRTTMYAEGGPPAGLYVSAGSVRKQWAGSFDLYPLPNVLGIVPRKAATATGN